MLESKNAGPLKAKKIPWNKSRFTGPKPPLKPKQVWSIRTRLHVARRTRDLALFDLAIDSKLRGCDLVRLKSPMSLSTGPCRTEPR